ncbi:hypothetical protein B0J12DRAFT_750517 [Macrophomina phaseolina]|uniref:Uncharacterized protein n=1 Tax=Macrophomina phaseolina TaxID=35725 RepID=A0ABQ8GDU8_9PEZI|nr:hypothetical protein B0J12DRAFT_750517 [Macrophomina phaseolina]
MASFTATEGKPASASVFFQCWGFDIMGDFALGKSFNMLKDKTPHFGVEMSVGHECPDPREEKEHLFLSEHSKAPEVYHYLLEGGGTNEKTDEGATNESLRLFYASPNGLQHLTPPEDVVITGCFIPGDTHVETPTWTVGRGICSPISGPDEERWMLTMRASFAEKKTRGTSSTPLGFIPEPRSSSPELLPQKDAFLPFLSGPYSRDGKPLAVMELKLAIAHVVSKFAISLDDEAESIRAFVKDSGWRDIFVAMPPPVRVCLKARN